MRRLEHDAAGLEDVFPTDLPSGAHRRAGRIRDRTAAAAILLAQPMLPTAAAAA